MKNLFDSCSQKINVSYKGVEMKDVATKVGGIFGPKGEEIGRTIDKYTKWITITLDSNNK